MKDIQRMIYSNFRLYYNFILLYGIIKLVIEKNEWDYFTKWKQVYNLLSRNETFTWLCTFDQNGKWMNEILWETNHGTFVWTAFETCERYLRLS